MRLLELLPPEHLFVPLREPTLREALGRMLRGLAAQGAVGDPAAVEQRLHEGSGRAIVPIGTSAVLPHTRTDAVEELVLALGSAPQPLGDAGISGAQGPRVIALVLAPAEASSLYLQAVATLARLLGDDAVVGKVVAAASPQALLSLPELHTARIRPRLTVRDVQGQRRSVQADMPLRDVITLLVHHGLKAVPVVGAKDEVLGIVTEWDIMKVLLPCVPRAADADDGGFRIPPDLSVRDVMTRSVLCISEDMSLDEVAAMMINKDVEQFPVVREGRLAGFLSRGEIIRKLFGR